MVHEILRERDHSGYSERNDLGSRMGGGMDVSIAKIKIGSVVFESNLST